MGSPWNGIDRKPMDLAIKSEFVLPDHRDALGTTTPIVIGGRLYVREDEQLFCYDVRTKSVTLGC